MSVGAIALVMMLEAASLESVPASSVALPSRVIPQSTGSPATEEQLVRDIIVRSYPNLRDTDIRLKTFRSNSDYFRTSFSLARFFIGASMQYFILVNPEWTTRGAPIEGVRSILAHELAHIDDFTHGKRIRLFRLVGLLLKGKAARFERRARPPGDRTRLRRGA